MSADIFIGYRQIFYLFVKAKLCLEYPKSKNPLLAICRDKIKVSNSANNPVILGFMCI